MYADEVEVDLFFFNKAVDEFGGGKDVVDKNVVEEFDVSAPFFKVISDEEGPNVGCVRDLGTVDFDASEDFVGLQVPVAV